MKRLLVRFWCWFRCHDFRWVFRDGRCGPLGGLVCGRCGHREEDGLSWCLKQLGK